MPKLTKAKVIENIKNGIPMSIDINDIHLLPRRVDFQPPDITTAVKRAIDRRDPVLFMPNTLREVTAWREANQPTEYHIYGVLPCGSKTRVILQGFPIELFVRVPSDMSVAQFKDRIHTMLVEEKCLFSGIDVVKLRPLHGFHKLPTNYICITTYNLQQRSRALKAIKLMSKGRESRNLSRLETANDDNGQNAYFNLLARKYRFRTADWNRIASYSVDEPDGLGCTYTLRVSIDNYCKLPKQRRAELMKGPLRKYIERDLTIVSSWDIETHSFNSEEAPKPGDDYTIFCMSTSYHWSWNDQPLYTVSAVHVGHAPKKGCDIIINCPTERDVLRAHYTAVSYMKADIDMTFNGGSFDWPIYIDKLERYGLLIDAAVAYSCDFINRNINNAGKTPEQQIKSLYTRKESIKIDAENTHEMPCVTTFPGMLNIDIMPIFLKLYPRAEVRKAASLNFFLQKNGIAAKVDLPIKRMFHTYERMLALREAPTLCHCDAPARTTCKACKTNYSDIDYETFEGEPIDVVHKCCACGKRARNEIDYPMVALYCTVDSRRPQELMVKRLIVMERRELANMAYVTLYEAFYRADGMKVCNLIGKYSNKRGIAFSNIQLDKPDEEKNHYPGAYVFPPNRGLHSDGMVTVTRLVNGVRKQVTQRQRPIVGIDFASLYPSLMICYNLSPDRVVYTAEEAMELMKEGYSLYRIEPFRVERGEKKDVVTNQILTFDGWTVRHNGVFEGDTTIVDHYEKYVTIGGVKYKAGEEPDGGSRKISYEPVRGRPALPEESIGIFSMIVKKLFDKRVPIKRKFVELSHHIEELRAEEQTEERKAEIASLEFQRGAVEAKQKAIKILANTFYGKSGDFRAPIYELLVAAGITTAGQASIKCIAEFVQNLGFTVHYGDTDSLYVSCPDDAFTTCDEKYFKALDEHGLPHEIENGMELTETHVKLRTAWWAEQVEITMREATKLTEKISDHLLQRTGTPFLNMAYEEVGFPTVLCGKKKYFMTPHEGRVNFENPVFIRGIDIIKQGQAPIAKKLGYEFMHEALAPSNTLDLLSLAEKILAKFFATKHDPSEFALSARYKPKKKNIPVHRFVERMRERYALTTDPDIKPLYEPPEPGDKFQYIIIKVKQEYTYRGTKIELKKGDQMEFINVFNKWNERAEQNGTEPMEIDLAHYLNGSIIGLFARFVAYHPRFQPPEGKYDIDDDKQYRAMDKECIDNAVDYLTEYCNRLAGINNKATAQEGRDRRRAYNTGIKSITANIAAHGVELVNVARELDPENVSKSLARLLETAQPVKPMMDVIKNSIFGGKVKDANPSKTWLLKHYVGNHHITGIGPQRLQLCDAMEKSLINEIRELVATTANAVDDYERKYVLAVTNKQLKDDAEVELPPIDNAIEPLTALHDMLYKLRAVRSVAEQTRAIMDAIRESCETIYSINMRSDIEEMKAMMRNAENSQNV